MSTSYTTTATKFKPALSLRQIAILRFLWSIDPSERNLLDECFLLRAEVYELLEESHIYFHGINHLVLWTEKVPVNLRHPVLLSIRRNRASNFAVALVRVRDRLPEGLQHLLSIRSAVNFQIAGSSSESSNNDIS